MDEHVRRYFSNTAAGGRFFQVVSLHEEPKETLEEAQRLAPRLPRGWWELAALTPADRVEFIRGFWQVSLPYIPHVDAVISRFFGSLDDIGIFLTQENEGAAFTAQMVFSQPGSESFFRGSVPAESEHFTRLSERFKEHALPKDYLDFLKIHDSFGKITDTGLIACSRIPLVYEEFQQLLGSREPLRNPKSPDEVVDPADLVPFYQSFGMDSYQCFYADWYPQQEMGNIYYSDIDHSLSDFTDRSSLAEHLAFPTFLDWLAFYLQLRVD